MTKKIITKPNFIIPDEEVTLVELKPTEKIITPVVVTPPAPAVAKTYNPTPVNLLSFNKKSTAGAILAYIVGGGYQEERLFRNRANWDVTTIRTLADIFVFTGGEDINPALYGEEPHSSVSFSDFRDRRELDAYSTIPADVLKFGICRGGQLLNVLNGGKLYQHVDGHHGNHLIKDTKTNALMMSNSIHHQMMIPGPGAVILATANMSTFRINAHGDLLRERNDFDTYSDPEVIWYPKTNSLCVQGHPEYPNCPIVFREFVFDLLETYYWDLFAENAVKSDFKDKIEKQLKHANDLGDALTRHSLN